MSEIDNAFEKWYNTYEMNGEELLLFNTIDLFAAYKAGYLQAMKDNNNA